MEVVVAVAASVGMRRGIVALLVLGAQAVDGKLLEVEGATDVDRKL
jgi:hypothetical protein